jgi:hypothetical protein
LVAGKKGCCATIRRAPPWSQSGPDGSAEADPTTDDPDDDPNDDVPGDDVPDDDPDDLTTSPTTTTVRRTYFCAFLRVFARALVGYLTTYWSTT